MTAFLSRARVHLSSSTLHHKSYFLCTSSSFSHCSPSLRLINSKNFTQMQKTTLIHNQFQAKMRRVTKGGKISLASKPTKSREGIEMIFHNASFVFVFILPLSLLLLLLLLLRYLCWKCMMVQEASTRGVVRLILGSKRRFRSEIGRQLPSLAPTILS